jgi:glutamate racemase
MADKKPISSDAIGIFDSGVGGLSIAQCMHHQLPHENIIYIADSLHAPYGEKSVEFIIERVNAIAQILLDKGVKAIVIACNTATVYAIEQLRDKVSIPIIGVEPAIKPAAKQSLSKKVAVLTTQATSENLGFKALINLHSQGSEVFIQPCPGLVEFIEKGLQDSKKCINLLKHYITPLVKAGVDTIVLGCTHYPFVQQQIRMIVGEQVTIIETAYPVTKQLKNRLTELNLTALNHNKGELFCYSSNATAQQEKIFSDLMRSKLTITQLN